MSKRGVVATPNMTETEGGFVMNGAISRELLHQYFTYWDEVAVVELRQGAFDFGLRNLPEQDEDMKVAAEEGLLRVEEVAVPGKTSWSSREFPAYYSEAQEEVFQQLNQRKGYWTIGQSVDRLILPEDESVTGGAITTRLMDALPVPGEDVGTEEILSFRERRESERLAFRKAYDQLYRDVLESEEKHLALEQAAEELEERLDDVRRAMEAGGLNPIQMSSEALWRIPSEAVGVAAAAHALGAPFIIEIAVGAIEAAIRVNSEERQQPEDLPDGIDDFAYLGRVEQEL